MSEAAIGKVVENIVLKAEEFFTARKRVPTEKAGPDSKKARVASSGGRGGRGGWQGPRGGGAVERADPEGSDPDGSTQLTEWPNKRP
jgi:hypothetical protein